MESNAFAGKNMNSVLRELGTSTDGITDEEAGRRLAAGGYNEILRKKEHIYVKFLKKFYGPIPFMLEAVIVLSYVLNDIRDFYVIIALLIFNAAIGFFEEGKADRSVELLGKRLGISARVLRSGVWKKVQARELVPGDIIRIRIGDIVPADAKVIREDYLHIDQSVLTGESLPVKKGASSIAYSGSVVKEGEARCVVVSTGYNTFFGKTAQLLQKARPKLHLEGEIIKVVKYLIAIDIVVTVFLFLFNIVVLGLSALAILPLLLVILIASVPVALPAAFTVTMALGTEKLAEKSILVTKLESIEETASVDVICFDKTGTLTMNELSVKEVFPSKGHTERDVIEAAALASSISDQDPIDATIINRAKEMGIAIGKYRQESFQPFQPAKKMSGATLSIGGRRFSTVKGAVDIILDICKAGPAEKKAALEKTRTFSMKKYRTIAVARKGRKYEFLGVVALYDSPRKDAKRLITEMHSLGIKTKILTGDNIEIAREIAKEVGVSGKVIDAGELRGKSEDEIATIAEDTEVFAGIFPEDKYTLVKALQSRGHRVAMGGDGVNDAPALKQAEVGIAVKNATDVARSAAALVLVEDGIEVLVNAVKESRRIFQRMVTYTIVKVIKVIQILFFITIAFVLLKEVPILPFELIILIFANDIVNMTVATDNVKYSVAPNKWDVKSLVYASVLLGIAFLAMSIVFIPVAAYLALGVAAFQTFSLLMFNITDKQAILSVRNRQWLWSSMPSLPLVASSFMSVLLLGAFAFFGILVQPISAYAILIMVVASTVMMFFFDVVKRYVFRYFGIV